MHKSIASSAPRDPGIARLTRGCHFGQCYKRVTVPAKSLQGGGTIFLYIPGQVPAKTLLLPGPGGLGMQLTCALQCSLHSHQTMFCP